MAVSRQLGTRWWRYAGRLDQVCRKLSSNDATPSDRWELMTIRAALSRASRRASSADRPPGRGSPALRGRSPPGRRRRGTRSRSRYCHLAAAARRAAQPLRARRALADRRRAPRRPSMSATTCSVGRGRRRGCEYFAVPVKRDRRRRRPAPREGGRGGDGAVAQPGPFIQRRTGSTNQAEAMIPLVNLATDGPRRSSRPFERGGMSLGAAAAISPSSRRPGRAAPMFSAGTSGSMPRRRGSLRIAPGPGSTGRQGRDQFLQPPSVAVDMATSSARASSASSARVVPRPRGRACDLGDSSANFGVLGPAGDVRSSGRCAARLWRWRSVGR